MFIEKSCHRLLSSVRAAYNALHMLSHWRPQEMAENNTATNILKQHLPSWNAINMPPLQGLLSFSDALL